MTESSAENRPKTSAGSTSYPNDVVAVLNDLTRHFRYLAEMGCNGMDCSAKSLDTINAWGSERSSPQKMLEAIRLNMGDCTRCKLSESRKNIVFGVGDPAAGLIFVGEGPGYDEDQKGEPFVGAAGQLLNKIIQAMKLTREEVYICNIVKCRPPGNRNPFPEEIKTCLPFLKRQISAIQPAWICTLGSVAAQSLLDVPHPISKIRGKIYRYQNIPVLPTYHPAYLLRNPQKKREVWEDMKKLMDRLS